MRLQNNGFSILMAIGIIAILMIVATGMTMVYLREFQLSRLSYDEVIASSAAEGVFEYGMLKIKNHAEGFEDRMTESDVDAGIFALHSVRSANLEVGYDIEAQSTNHTFTGIASRETLIVPLFVGTGETISNHSIDPRINRDILQTEKLRVTGIDGLQWTLVSMTSDGQSIGMIGNDDMNPTSKGTIRERASQCYDRNGEEIDCTRGDVEEELVYFTDTSSSVSDFITANGATYLMIYNSLNHPIDITLMSDTAFALPRYTVNARSKNGDALQIFRFSEDKSKYYDAIKYGVYNTGE